MNLKKGALIWALFQYNSCIQKESPGSWGDRNYCVCVQYLLRPLLRLLSAFTKMSQVLMDNPDPKQTDAHNHLTLQIVTILKKNVLFHIASMLKNHLYSDINIFHKRHNWSIRRKKRYKNRNCLKLQHKIVLIIILK